MCHMSGTMLIGFLAKFYPIWTPHTCLQVKYQLKTAIARCSLVEMTHFLFLQLWLQKFLLLLSDRCQKYYLQPEILTIKVSAKLWHFLVNFCHFCIFFWFSLFSLPYDKKLAFIFYKTFLLFFAKFFFIHLGHFSSLTRCTQHIIALCTRYYVQLILCTGSGIQLLALCTMHLHYAWFRDPPILRGSGPFLSPAALRCERPGDEDRVMSGVRPPQSIQDVREARR